MSTPRVINPEELMLYAMQSLGVGEAAEMQVRLEQDPSARRELAELHGDLAALALTAEFAAPSTQARTRLLKQIAEEPRPSSLRGMKADEPNRESMETLHTQRLTSSSDARRSRGAEIIPIRRGAATRLLPWAGWAAAAALAFTAGHFYRDREGLRRTIVADQTQLAHTAAEAATAREVLSAMNDQTAMRVTLTRTGTTASPTGRTIYSAEKGVLIFTASDLAPVATFKVYELWLIPTNGGAPVPAGTFHPDAKGYANLVSTEMPKGVEAKAFGITIEDDGGSKTPTLPIVMTGA